ncbi:BTAD domain-containing putative transcriptional regulator [Streptomyces sp. NBC_00996]|uniref:BTAD domain-containing putative transcriptional regulator n=1 Tax=Streptomyces sp. NBC_00996 TaxID=2903710 RepID=UPI003870523A|nr:NB-ARC domain-containing protein [Streptomyces sp. NBC_00996]
MDFQVLGPVEARKGGERIALSGSKVHTVLASLLLARGRVVSDERLSSMLWGWEPPATAGAQIYTYMSRLRKLLGDEVEIDRRPPGYVLRAPHSTVDLLEFEQLDREGRTALGRGRHLEASSLLSRALGLWRGAALGNVTEYLAGAELARLEELRLHALESRVEADLELGRHEQLTAELTGLVAEFPLREKLRAQLMTAFYRCGQQADALHTYHEGRKVLDEQLGIEPGEALGATYQAVLVGSLGAKKGAPVRTVVSASYGDGDPRDPYEPRPATLPPDIEDFIGREEELAALCGQLAESRKGGGPRALLVTGMAGVGKTALAVRAAHRSAAHFPDGQLFAELAHPDGRPKKLGEVLTVLLRALGAPVDGTGRTADLDELIRRYRTRTAGRRLLVVLDGAVDSRELDLLLPGSAAAAVLITGRARLTRVAQARTTVLTPFERENSYELLAAGVGRRRLLAEPDATNEVLAHCGGLPLAVRIAGSRLAARSHWPVSWLASRLADPEHRLRELSYGGLELRRALLPSLRQLPRQAGRTLVRLAGIGTEPFPAQRAARHLAEPESAAEESLEHLVDAALLDICGVDRLGRPLYRFHELVLLFAESLASAHRERERSTAAH